MEAVQAPGRRIRRPTTRRDKTRCKTRCKTSEGGRGDGKEFDVSRDLAVMLSTMTKLDLVDLELFGIGI